MGTLIVYCENRPKDEIIEVSTFGGFVNMHVYQDVPEVEGTVKVGTPIPQGVQSKLPVVEGVKARRNLVMRTLEKTDQVTEENKEGIKDAMIAEHPTKEGGSK